MVSKAALNSRSTRAADSPESTINKISLKPFKSAVSVLWCFFFLNQTERVHEFCFHLKKPEADQKLFSPKTFEMNGSWEIGL